MENKALVALQESIQRWEKRAAGDATPAGRFDCPLCVLYWDADCQGCPVYERTGHPYCADTPYENYYVSRDPKDAQKEVDFLKSLLPEAVKPAEDFNWSDLGYLEKKEESPWS